jgi:hypothetical protein
VTTRYLLPCSCGRKVLVEARQAGGVVKCGCGASLEVPTMLEMAALERAEPESAAPRPRMRWGVRQSVALLGLVIFLIALGLGIYQLLTPPEPPPTMTAEQTRRIVDAFTPVESLQVWRMFRSEGLDEFETSKERDYRRGVLIRRLWMGVVVVVALAGLGLLVTPLLIDRRTAASRRGQAARQTGIIHEGSQGPD